MNAKGYSIAEYLRNQKYEHIAIWGLGNVGKLLADTLQDIDITAIIQSNPEVGERYGNIPIISVDEVPNETQLIIVVPVYDMEEIKNKVNGKFKIIGVDELVEQKL